MSTVILPVKYPRHIVEKWNLGKDQAGKLADFGLDNGNGSRAVPERSKRMPSKKLHLKWRQKSNDQPAGTRRHEWNYHLISSNAIQSIDLRSHHFLKNIDQGWCRRWELFGKPRDYCQERNKVWPSTPRKTTRNEQRVTKEGTNVEV